MNPDRYAVIYNSKYDNDGNLFDKRSSNSTTSVAISSSPYASPPSHYTKVPLNYYYNEYQEGVLEIASSFLKILLNQMVDNTMVAAIKEK
jgi:hypothetical protein